MWPCCCWDIVQILGLDVWSAKKCSCNGSPCTWHNTILVFVWFGASVIPYALQKRLKSLWWMCSSNIHLSKYVTLTWIRLNSLLWWSLLMYAYKLQMAPTCVPVGTPLSYYGVVWVVCIHGVIVGLDRVVPSFACQWLAILFLAMLILAMTFWFVILSLSFIIDIVTGWRVKLGAYDFGIHHAWMLWIWLI